jgi:outer membrane protein assembly factor BamB
MLLFIVSSVTPMVIGYDDVESADREVLLENLAFACSDRYGSNKASYYREHLLKERSDDFDKYHLSELYLYEKHSQMNRFSDNNVISKELPETNLKETTIGKTILTKIQGIADSAWPMYCHDIRHTGRSPYSTTNNQGSEKWRFKTVGWVGGSPVIDENGIIYIGADYLYSLYPNGTLRWKCEIPMKIETAPAISEDGDIFIGTKWAMPNYLYALHSNGTLKWKYNTDDDIFSSPAIGDDGTIYFGDSKDYINALSPDGTLKWRYQTGHVVYSSPAIGEDGTVYCGSHDSNLYALYPNNGTLKWNFDTGNWIRTSPCIADDGTIYIVSLDNYLYAIRPNGTLKWKTNVGAGTSPTIGQDGTIYCGYSKLYAINPTDGSVKWTFNPGSDRRIRGGTPCNSIDGTIYFGTHIGEYYGGEIIAVNPNGTEKWRKMIATDWVDSAPAIAEDGTIYIGSTCEPSDGYLHAFGPGDMKKIEIEKPKDGHLYMLNHLIRKSFFGRTIIFGDIDVKASATLPDEVEKVRFRLKSNLIYSDQYIVYEDTEPPYEWHIDASDLEFRFCSYNLEVRAYYKGGCEWFEDMDMILIYFL